MTSLRNIEVKAEVGDGPAWEHLLTTAGALSGAPGTLIKQADIFFNSPNGRLKMRSLSASGKDENELIWYDRSDQEGPKLSSYDKVTLSNEEAQKMTELLRHSNGVRGEVRKQRVLFMVGQTRVHCDDVVGLGKYAELEVCLREDQTIEEGEAIAKDLMGKLGLKNLIEGAYMDLLLAKK